MEYHDDQILRCSKTGPFGISRSYYSGIGYNGHVSSGSGYDGIKMQEAIVSPFSPQTIFRSPSLPSYCQARGTFPGKLLRSFIFIPVRNTNALSAFSRKPQYLTFKVSFRYSLTSSEVMDLITGLNLGVEAIIICVTSAPKPDQSDTAMTYLVGLKNPIFYVTYVCNLVGKELSQYIIANPEFIKRRGWNAVCAVFPERDSHILLWGISSEEFIARQYASSQKVSLYKAKAIINGAGHRGTISVHSPTHSPTADGAASSNIPIPIPPIPRVFFYLTLYFPSHVLLKGAGHFALKLASFLPRCGKATSFLKK